MSLRAVGVVIFAVFVLSPSMGMANDQAGFEIRGGIFAHSVDEPSATSTLFNIDRIEDANIELLWSVPSLTQWVAWGEVRPHLGATINFNGLESMVYGGVTWTLPLADTPIFLEASFGAAVHNGSTGPWGLATHPARDLGCSLLFRESASVGFMITENASIMATIEHASNANMCQTNRGLTNMGVRAGWRF